MLVLAMFDKKEKQLDRLVHVMALSALHQADPSYKTKAELEKYAFPLEIELNDDNDFDVVFGDEA